VASIKEVVGDMASTIRQLQAGQRPSFWRSIFAKRPKMRWRFREKRDFSQALNADLDNVAIPAGLEWLREAIGQPGNPEGRSPVTPRFDQATIRALACFMHSLTLTIERLKAEQASRPSGFIERFGTRSR
jgi:hypothetical protein